MTGGKTGYLPDLSKISGFTTEIAAPALWLSQRLFYLRQALIYNNLFSPVDNGIAVYGD